LEDFKHDFEHYCKEIHQVFATLDSRTAERQNTRLSADTVKSGLLAILAISIAIAIAILGRTRKFSKVDKTRATLAKRNVK